MKKLFTLVLFVMSAISLSVAQRLPHEATPENYKLTFTPNLEKATFEGDETISIRVLKSTSEITLNAVDIAFHDVTITSNGSTQNAKASTRGSPDGTASPMCSSWKTGAENRRSHRSSHTSIKRPTELLVSVSGRLFTQSSTNTLFATAAPLCGSGRKNGSAGGRTKEWLEAGEDDDSKPHGLILSSHHSTKPGQDHYRTGIKARRAQKRR